jgi:DNA-directed RNA polymerase subunit RPC12/RpoP
MAICSVCGSEYSDKRKNLGYDSCLKCGDRIAYRDIQAKYRRTAPLYNKGGYQYITNGDSLKSLGRKV